LNWRAEPGPAAAVYAQHSGLCHPADAGRRVPWKFPAGPGKIPCWRAKNSLFGA